MRPEELHDLARGTGVRGTLPNAEIIGRAGNLSCGDALTMYVRLDPLGTVTHATFDGDGCVLCCAAAALCAQHIVGVSVERILALTAQDMVQWFGVPPTPARSRCWMLPLIALQRGCTLWKNSLSTISR